MSYLTTELLTSLLQGGAAANEFLRSKIEEGVNAVLKAELAGFLGYEKHSSAGWNTGNSCNGFYQRTIVTSYGKITVYENFHTFYRLHSSNVDSLYIYRCVFSCYCNRYPQICPPYKICKYL